MILFGASFLALALALLLDRFVVDPEWLWRRLPHPVVGIGAIITWWERTLRPRHADALLSGAGLLAALVAVSGTIGLVPQLVGGAAGWALETAAITVMLAQRSLAQHVRAVASGLRWNLEDGRRAVGMIVGRDTAALDEAGVARAAVESLAENFCDGVVAPIYWYALLGLPGLLIYKAVNTADSMIGHRTPRYVAFGRPAARLDDVMNFLPARLTAGLVAAAAGRFAVWEDAERDARHHRSPNAGWPEAAMAAALGLSLGGPRTYRQGGREEVVDEPAMNPAGRREATARDIRSALALYDDALNLLVLAAAVAFLPLLGPAAAVLSLLLTLGWLLLHPLR